MPPCVSTGILLLLANGAERGRRLLVRGYRVRRSAILATVVTTALVLVLPFVGGSGPSPFAAPTTAYSLSAIAGPVASTTRTSTVIVDAETASALLSQPVAAVQVASTAPVTVDSEHLAQKPVPPPAAVSTGGAASGTAARRAAALASGRGCPGNVGGGFAGAPGAVSSGGVAGTTSADLASFAAQYNSLRVANCLSPVPTANFRYDSCMEQRLFWMAQDPSSDPGNTWGHAGVHSLAPDANGVFYSDAVPSVGCDGNLAGGSGNSGATMATKWWESPAHQKSLYKPTYSGAMGGICIYFAMTHGDGNLGAELYSFTRAAARWSGC